MKDFDHWLKEMEQSTRSVTQEESREQYQCDFDTLRGNDPDKVIFDEVDELAYETDEGYMVQCRRCEGYFEWPGSYEELTNATLEMLLCGGSPRCCP